MPPNSADCNKLPLVRNENYFLSAATEVELKHEFNKTHEHLIQNIENMLL